METLGFERNRYKAAQYCPCGKSNQDGKFAPRIGQTKVGYCFSCVKTFYDDNKEVKQYHKPPPTPPTLFLKRELVDKSITGSNNFLTYLHSIFDDATVQQLKADFNIGNVDRFINSTSNYYANQFRGGVVFWYIDLHGNVRSGKVMKYGLDGHRIKMKPEAGQIHTILKVPNFKANACLYGLHLLNKRHENGMKSVVAVVESEKTAIIASAYLPEFAWVATGGASGINRKSFECIKDREIALYPDKGCYNTWRQAAETELKGFKWSISKWIEGTDAAEGADIADILTKEPPRTQKQLKNNSITTQKQRRNNVETVEKRLNAPNPKTQEPTQNDWDADEFKEISKTHNPNTSDLRDVWGVDDILNSMKGKALPDTLILTSGEVITNVRHMVKTHIAIVKAQNGKKAYLPYLKRLQELKQALTINSNF